MLLGIDPKVDYAFKHLLGRDATRPILIDVIEKVLNLPSGVRLDDVELLNPFNPKEALDDKLSILDIKARDNTGRLFNVEMQMLARPSYPKRIVYYGAKLHQQQLGEGDDYVKLRPTISISFLNNVLFANVTDHHLWFRLSENTHGFALSDDIEFHILELPKFTKSLEQLGSGLDTWLYFLRHAAKIDLEAVPPALRQPLVLRALEELKMLSQTDLERERYEARWKAQMDRNSDLFEARAQGEQIGMIHAYEGLLKRTETPTEQLERLSVEALTRMAAELQALVQNQRAGAG